MISDLCLIIIVFRAVVIERSQIQITVGFFFCKLLCSDLSQCPHTEICILYKGKFKEYISTTAYTKQTVSTYHI